VALLQKQLQARGIRVVNGSISGDTTSGGRSRLPALLAAHSPTHVVIELGGNDALRGLPMTMTRDNLSNMVNASKAAKAQVLLLGMQLPPNYGSAYAKDFSKAFDDVAKANKVALVPFFLKGVADDADPLKFFQSDRIHPNEAAQPIMLANVLPALNKLLPAGAAKPGK
jgi:acyl-CoA thioesterase I